MKSLVLASGNPGKHAEIQALLAPFGTRVVTQVELGITEAEEPHDSFLENALAKARHACVATRLPALADDSGLCVDALGGAPGVHSAYYAGHEGSRAERDARNNAKLLAELAPHDDRRAHYECVLVLMRGPGDTQPLVAQAQWRGAIARAPRGGGGFGYDPLFLPDGLDKTAAELAPEEKNRISHRGQALARLLELLKREP
ncbi:MAG TPA: RdgB/HAM1 family non-canonical purine NTP pyrophosphatase [Burkholderiales bacterium]|nr:RdgB/HAM1 family non-canonical purine NTP pyrophosphatase [Burkholderiales bacterium]